MTTVATKPDTDDPPMATACPMHLIAGVTVEQIRHEDGTVDRKIEVVLDCSCRYFISLPLTIPAPQPGNPSHCHGAHGT